MKADWEHVLEYLRGKKYEISDADLAYRTLGEQRADEIRAKAGPARDAFAKKWGAVPLASLPAVDPIRGKRNEITGKIVQLPKTGNRDWLSEAGHGWLYAEGANGTLYFVDGMSPAFGKATGARYRYQQLVTPQIDETHELIGRVAQEPKMIVSSGSVYTGFRLEVLADLVAGTVFVDVSGDEKEPRFAGEELLHKPSPIALTDSAPPEEVMKAFVAAIKLGEEDLWKNLFAEWTCEPWDDRVYFKPHDPPTRNRLDENWVRARRQILGSVYDVRVAEVHPVRALLTGSEFEGAPKVDRVKVEMNPVGLFDGEYRAFKDINVHRVWELQRVNGGPWRISTIEGI